MGLGWYEVVKGLFMKGGGKMVDVLLVGVKAEYEKKGVKGLVLWEVMGVYEKVGFVFGERKRELEEKGKVEGEWEYLKREEDKGRRGFRKGM